MRKQAPTLETEFASGHHLDVITGLQLLRANVSEPAALAIIETAISEIRDLRGQILAIKQAVAIRLEQKQKQEAQLQKAAADLQAKRQQEAAEQDK